MSEWQSALGLGRGPVPYLYNSVDKSHHSQLKQARAVSAQLWMGKTLNTLSKRHFFVPKTAFWTKFRR